MSKKQTLIKNQSGIASMVIVILIMTLLSLIVVSMTRNANREQRQALDRQLNSQAFYAAESGVNDAKKYYIENAAAAEEQKNSCGPVSGADSDDQFPGLNSQVGADNNRYTCVIYDATPDSLQFTSVKRGESTVVPLETLDNSTISTITFKWKKQDTNTPSFNSCPGGTQFPPSLPANCDAGVLRIELIDTTLGLGREALISNSFLSFVLPGSSATNANYLDGAGITKQGVIWQGGCSGSECTLTINTAVAGKSKFLLHLRSIYYENSVSITAKDVGGNTVKFKNGQLMIDSTGRAADVLKRIQVRVPLHNFGGPYPEFALQTTDAICKQLQIVPPDIADATSRNYCSN